MARVDVDRDVSRGVVDRDVDVVVTEPAVGPDLISWGAIWAGLLVGFGTFVLLSLVALAAGLEAAPFEAPQETRNLVAAIITTAFVVLAFFAGGFTAAWATGTTDMGRAVLHGFLVWALWLLVVFILAAFAAQVGAQLFGAVAGVFGGQFRDVSPEANTEELLRAFRNAAWQSVFVVFLAAVSAVLGGAVATRDEIRRVKWPTFG
ncbi:MAG: hypothetical protein M3N29_07200 [Chloroflexota bacterium]|nr:hypothetical protein [Chloroflexota bacterium]